MFGDACCVGIGEDLSRPGADFSVEWPVDTIRFDRRDILAGRRKPIPNRTRRSPASGSAPLRAGKMGIGPFLSPRL